MIKCVKLLIVSLWTAPQPCLPPPTPMFSDCHPQPPSNVPEAEKIQHVFQLFWMLPKRGQPGNWTHPLPRVLPWPPLPLIGYIRGLRELERQSASSSGPPLILLPWSTRNLLASTPYRRWSLELPQNCCSLTLALGIIHCRLLQRQVLRGLLCLILHLRVLLGPPKDPSAGTYGSAQRRFSNKSTP